MSCLPHICTSTVLCDQQEHQRRDEAESKTGFAASFGGSNSYVTHCNGSGKFKLRGRRRTRAAFAENCSKDHIQAYVVLLRT